MSTTAAHPTRKAGSSPRSRAATSGWHNDSSTAQGTGVAPSVRRSRPDTGSSTNSGASTASATRRDRASSPIHAPLASSRSVTEGPMAARSARSASSSAGKSVAPSFTLRVVAPASRAALARGTSAPSSAVPSEALRGTTPSGGAPNRARMPDARPLREEIEEGGLERESRGGHRPEQVAVTHHDLLHRAHRIGRGDPSGGVAADDPKRLRTGLHRLPGVTGQRRGLPLPCAAGLVVERQKQPRTLRLGGLHRAHTLPQDSLDLLDTRGDQSHGPGRTMHTFWLWCRGHTAARTVSEVAASNHGGRFVGAAAQTALGATRVTTVAAAPRPSGRGGWRCAHAAGR